MRFVETIRLTHRKLPHWEVRDGRYFVTVRCADSLPAAALERLLELKRASNALSAASPQAATAQRQLFRTLEKYLDAGHGSCPLSLSAAARVVIEELGSLTDWRIAVPHFTIMPNHWHALIGPLDATARSLSAILKRVKGRTAKRIRKLAPAAVHFGRASGLTTGSAMIPNWNVSSLTSRITRESPTRPRLAAASVHQVKRGTVL